MICGKALHTCSTAALPGAPQIVSGKSSPPAQVWVGVNGPGPAAEGTLQPNMGHGQHAKGKRGKQNGQLLHRAVLMQTKQTLPAACQPPESASPTGNCRRSPAKGRRL
eukprot:CAMPEP_0174289436 /NCGR_PEP_ID=MMETSP0809-20121228/25074_1 /TAXON_ID=73025 ORGANISM="Eutreptiella gymnastica-like, Strain CCMP1594" /NCGR_SAMPLE_ID=MMETSP0809 /ASSEMBLY_ACC=CAM_ASM_000658 /LENGTH=107 /DNA_ID=CAMNT_0015387395 /DNA_START=11 /DNA_END=331 /DNA_ORIENTATION=-